MKAGAWPHPVTVARTGFSSAVEALELDAAVMEAMAAHVAAASPTDHLESSNNSSGAAASEKSFCFFVKSVVHFALQCLLLTFL